MQQGTCLLQVIFCSRTHSQLSQFVSELRRTGLGERLALLPLGSRKALCINDDVRALGHGALMNERCMELQRQRAAARSSAGARAKTQAVVVPPLAGEAPQSMQPGAFGVGGAPLHSVSGMANQARPQRGQCMLAFC